MRANPSSIFGTGRQLLNQEVFIRSSVQNWAASRPLSSGKNTGPGPEPKNLATPTRSSTASLWSDCTSTRWRRRHSLTLSWRHAAVMSQARCWPRAPDADTVWSEAARRQMNQRRWRLIVSRIAFFLSIHHSVTSFRHVSARRWLSSLEIKSFARCCSFLSVGNEVRKVSIDFV